MLRIRYITTILLLSLLASCKSEEDSSMLWGKTDFYDDFLFMKYHPVVMSKTLCFEFNEDALTRVKEVRFGLYQKDSQGTFIPVQNEVVLFLDGVACARNEFAVTPQKKEVELGIEFTAKGREGVHKLFLKVVDNGGIDRVNEFSTENEGLPLLLEWNAEKNVIVNPLKLGTIIFMLVLIGAFLFWIVLVRPQCYPFFKVKKLFVLCDGKQMTYSLSGAYQVICTSRKRKQGVLDRIIKGKVIYIVNPFWLPGDIIISPKDKNSIKVRVTPQYRMMPNVVSSKQPGEIKHNALEDSNIVIFRV